MGRSPGCYIPIFVEIGQPVTEKKLLKRFLPYVDLAAILVMRPASNKQILISMYLKAYIKKLVKNDPVVLRKACFNFHT